MFCAIADFLSRSELSAWIFFIFIVLAFFFSPTHQVQGFTHTGQELRQAGSYTVCHSMGFWCKDSMGKLGMVALS